MSDLNRWDKLRDWWNLLLNHEARHLAGGGDPFIHGATEHTNVTRDKYIRISSVGGAWGSVGYFETRDLPNGADTDTFFNFKIPSDFVSLVNLRVLCFAALGVGDIVWDMRVSYCAEGEAWNIHVDTDLTNVQTVPGVAQSLFSCIGDATILQNANIGDLVGLDFRRVGLNLSDTLAGNLNVAGALLTYVAEQ